ncbi:MAG: hypothetical protein K9L28_04335 [Synergistales bacterium]|nr:hypothetical protein [Synergistales bacterium]
MIPGNRGLSIALLLILFGSLLCPSAATAVNTAQEKPPVLALQADGQGGLYLATAERAGIYHSPVGTRSWNYLGERLPSSYHYSLHRSRQGSLYLATYEALLHSDDGGDSWTPMRNDGWIRDVHVTASGKLITLHWNEGLLWQDGQSGDVHEAKGELDDHLVTALAENESGRLWAGTFGGGVFSSDDGGMSWQGISDDLPNPFVLALAWSPSSASLYAGCLEGGVFRWNQNGWISDSAGLPEKTNVQVLRIAKDDSVWAGTETRGCHILPSGKDRWQPVPARGKRASSIWALESVGDQMVVGTAANGLFLAEQDGTGWMPLPIFDPVIGFAETGESGVLALTQSGRLFRSPDGESWEDAGQTGIGAPCTALLHLEGDLLLAGGPGGIYRSTDSGTSWTRVSLPSALGRLHDNTEKSGAGDVVALAEAGEAVFAITWMQGLFRSNDAGKSWKQVEGIEGKYFRSLATDGSNAAAVATDYGISFSRDGGATWRTMKTPPDGCAVAFDGTGSLWGSSRLDLWRGAPEEDSLQTANRMQGYQYTTSRFFRQIFAADSSDTVVALSNTGTLFRFVTDPETGERMARATNLSDSEIFSFISLADGGLLLGTRQSLYRSDDGGMIWKKVELY